MQPEHRPQQARSGTPPQAPQDDVRQPGATGGGSAAPADTERHLRRAQFLRDLAQARRLRDRVQPRRARAARYRQAMRMRAFRS
ncbi:hypothetical protein [Streptomyces thermodiastaticus]|jgi:hypothetical protein|uniref:hypothetical protein n=1 Tax=Streptomyces thermodiastaticus TaxID=44061 RepID=UPI0019A7B613|nr:hypothetical protein [Streptomyces thermodiastaticus]MCE7550556.1 hypothetical protein [Streptomyces thermodiastaticus]GHF95520.1 hypothetical protein GCM10018787_50300 [Streptomyces thermodiastaticus]